MKILTIHLKNINSLQGEHLINFNQAPLVNVSVFAITGPNGSGKTSVLDAITLALFGETFKFDRPAAHVMTRNSADCFAQVEFQVGGSNYRSRWQVDQDSQNNLQISMQVVQQEDGALLATDVISARALNSQIIGLDFRNFTRSILLAQGDFAAFLNALDTERLDILEKIANTDIYAQYKLDLRAEADQAELKLQQVQKDLEDLVILDTAGIEAKQADLADFQIQQREYQDGLEALYQSIEQIEHAAALETQLDEFEQTIQVLGKEAEQAARQLALIERHQDVAELQTDFNFLGSLEQTLDEEQAVVNEYKQQLKQLESLLGSARPITIDSSSPLTKSFSEQQDLIADLTFQNEQTYTQQKSEQTAQDSLQRQLIEKQTIAENIQQWLEEHTQDASLLDGFPDIGKLKKLSIDIAHLKSQQVAHLKQTKASTQKLQKHNNERESIQQRLPKLELEITQLTQQQVDLARGLSFEELETLRNEQQERVSDFKDLVNLSKINRRFKDNLLVRLGLLTPPADLDVETIQTQLAELNKQFEQEENIKISLEHAVYNEALVKRMQSERVHLTKGQPCPLCGSLKHPFANSIPKVSDSNQALADQKSRIQTLATKISKAQQQLKVAEKQAQTKQLRHDRLLRVQSEWSSLSNRLGVLSKELDLDDTRQMKKLLVEQERELKDIEQIVKEYRQLQQKIVKLTAEVKLQREVLEQLQIAAEELDSNVKNVPENLKSVEQSLAQLIAEEQSLSEQVQTQLTLLGEKMPAKGKDDVLFNRLNKRRQEYQTYVLREKHVQEEILELQQQLKLSLTALETHDQELQKISLKLEIEQSVSLHLAVLEKQKLIQDKAAYISQVQAQIHALQQSLQQQAQNSQIANFAELSEILQLLPEKAAIEQQQTDINRRIQQHTTQISKLRSDLQREHAALSSKINLTDFEAEQRRLNEKLAITELEIEHLSQLLAQQETLQEKFATLSALKIQYQAEFVQSRQDLELLYSSDGHAFRRKVQIRLAEKLLTQTNNILEKINGRYYVRQASSEQGLALEIEDTFQQNTRRLPKTLSGGESFVISLALALGLSELASNGQSIESLFLDEGFGNLDADTLYTVVSTLENLHYEGKKVGIISHVEGVRKRIKNSNRIN